MIDLWPSPQAHESATGRLYMMVQSVSTSFRVYLIINYCLISVGPGARTDFFVSRLAELFGGANPILKSRNH